MDTIHDSPAAQDDYFPGLPPFIIDKVRNLPLGISEDQILQELSLLENNLSIQHNSGSTSLYDSKAQLGICWILTLSLRMKTTSVRITGQWENVIWKIVSLAKQWLPYNIRFDTLEATTWKPWILAMFTDTELCPNPHLRLEMLRFVSMWPETFLEDATSGMQAAAGLVSTSAYITLDHLMPGELKVSLFYSLKRVLKSLNKYGHLDVVAAAAIDQVRGLKVGPEATFFNHLVQLLKKQTEAIEAQYQSGNHYYSEWYTLSVFVEMMQLYRMLVVTTPTAYGVPGLAQAAAAFLVTMTSSIVTMYPNLHMDGHDFKCLVADMDDVYEKISALENFAYFSLILKLDHAQYLSLLSKKTTELDFFHHLPVSCQESPEVPDEFIDSVTQVAMEAPVLLHSSKMVIDESTLIRLLLESPSDPFTRCPLGPGSYSRLPDLQADILAWRNTSGVSLR